MQDADDAPAWGWDTDPSLNLARLVDNGTMDAGAAALLWLCASHRLSVIVAGGPRQIGKTTLAAAYRDALPPGTTLVYARGMWEDFAWVGRTDPRRIAILVAEFSNHMPFYLNGEAAQRVLELAARDGYGIVGTLHAESPEEALATLAGPGLDIDPHLLGVIDVVATLTVRTTYARDASGARSPRRVERRLSEIASVASGTDRLPETVSLVTYDRTTDSHLMSKSPQAWSLLALRLGMDAQAAAESLARRRSALQSLVERRALDTPAVRGTLWAEAWR